MKTSSTPGYGRSNFVKLQGKDWLEKQRISGKVVGDGLRLLEKLVNDKTTKSLLELDKIIGDFITSNDCTPTFKNFNGFPNNCCMSVNNQLVHGIPTDYKLQDGDVVTFDFGATFEEVVSDAARTFIFGEPKFKQHIQLLKTTKECLIKAIESIEVGKHLGVIGDTIYRHGRNNGFAVVDVYGGHGIGLDGEGKACAHMPPFVSNRSNSNEGLRIQPGLVIAIEPLLVLGNSNKTYTSKDGWTVMAENICAHEEHSIYVHEDHVEVLTK